MRKFLGWSFLSCLLLARVHAVKVGDSYDQVIAEKGASVGKMMVGEIRILRYPDQTIKLKADRVIAIEAPARAASTVHEIIPPVVPKPKAAQSAEAGTTLTWGTDFDTALAEAKAQNRKVFMFFTGSDWCGWCKRLQKEILTQPEFSQYARENLVLLEVDFPRSVPQSEAQKTANRTLAKRFRIEGYPTVIVLGSDGKSVGRLGYQEGGPAPFIDALKRF